MKYLAQRPMPLREEIAQVVKGRCPSVVIGSIPGLERLLPGRYAPGETVRSRYGKWTLPRSFRGRAISAIVNGTMFG
ncbi:MAG TPA: hypothetical protein VF574_08230 [Allosphingosinicella sp.]|jgi:hypothetical protein